MPVLIAALLASAIVPVLYYFFISRLREDDEYRSDCRRLLFSGIRISLAVCVCAAILSILFNVLGLGDVHPLAKNFLSSFVTAALLEEFFKYTTAKKVIYDRSPAVSFLDVMAYCCCAATAFELLESFVYMFFSNPAQILVRGLTDMHAVFGFIMGYVIAKGYKKGDKSPAVKAVLLAAFIHGMYDFCLDESLEGSLLGYLPVPMAAMSIVALVYSIFFFKKAVKDPYYTEPLFTAGDEGSGAEETSAGDEDAGAGNEESGSVNSEAAADRA